MATFFYDRFNGNLYQTPERRYSLIGRWLLVPDPGETVVLNTVPVSDWDFLVPDPSGNWKIRDSSGNELHGAVARGQLLDENEANGLRAIGEQLAARMGCGANWLDWLSIVPLVPRMTEKIELFPLERKLLETKPVNYLGHLETVCLRPRAHLYVEIERMGISRARRLPVNAASYLASHSEDWECLRLRGVLPKRILSEMRCDLIDIYENRMAARLIDGLVIYLGRRIATVRKAIKTLRIVMGYEESEHGSEDKTNRELRKRSDVLQHCTYRLARRISELWGKSLNTDRELEKAEDTLTKLEQLKYRVTGLIDSPLYEEVSRRTFVAPKLTMTNILVNDQHYRRVAKLWKIWEKAERAKKKSALDFYREFQELCHGMDRFCFLLVVRALAQLEYWPSDLDIDKPISTDGQWTLEGHGIRLCCQWEKGRIRLNANGKSLTFVTLPMDLTGASSDSQGQNLLEVFEEAMSKNQDRTIVLYAGSVDEPSPTISIEMQRKLYSIGNDPRTGLPDSLAILPVSSWDISSVERVARALRWFLDSVRFDAYQSKIKWDREVWPSAGELGKGWLEIAPEQNSLVMLRAPTDLEWRKLGLEGLVDKAKCEREQAKSEHDRLLSECKNARQQGNTTTLNQQKRLANQQLIIAQQRFDVVRKLFDDMCEARKHAEELLTCPACRKSTNAVVNFHPRSKGCFRSECPTCRTFWETRLCSKGHRYAVMLPGNFVESEDNSPGWVDRTYGSDLLALPARTADGRWGFVCPYCGEIT